MWRFGRKANYDRLVREYEARLGRMTLAWSAMEAGLDYCVTVIFWLYRPDRANLKERPLSLEKKLRFLRICHNKLPELEPFRGDGLKLASSISDIMNQRHKLVHGVPVHYLDNGDVMIASFRMQPQTLTLEMPIIRARSIDDLGKKARQILRAANAHAMAISPDESVVRKQHPQPFREAAEQILNATRRLPASERSLLKLSRRMRR